MAEIRASLCSQCGSSEWEELSDTQIRCAECGLGATRGVLQVFRSDPSYDPMSADAIRQREENARARAAEHERIFEGASFSPYALDARWVGLRSIGGYEQSDRGIHMLELAHSDDPYDPASPQVRIGTHATGSGSDLPAHEWRIAQSLVHYFWHETGVLPDDVRRALFQTDRRDFDPFGPWDAAQLTVDSTRSGFRVLAHDDFWVGVGSHGDDVITIRSRGWAPGQAGIVTVDDLAPYVEGSIAIATRWRPA